MNICVVENKAKVQIQDNENIFSLGFFSSDKTFLISENSETVAFKLFKNAEVSINSQLDKLEINFTKAAKYLQFITFELNVESIFDIEKDYLRFSAGDGIYVLDFINTSFSFDSSSKIIVALSEGYHSIKLYKNENFDRQFKSKSFEALTISNPFLIDETSKMPEFSIGIFDDAEFSTPRPIRQGNPIISTVPSVVNDNSTADDIDYYNSGNGPDSKTIYFKIICNQILENALSSGDLSTNLQLKVYLPNGLDTVKVASYEDIYFVSKDTTNNISVYSGSYTFYKQGTYNNIDYVDGFMYFDIHCPLTVQKSLPFQFDFSI